MKPYEVRDLAIKLVGVYIALNTINNIQWFFRYGSGNPFEIIFSTDSFIFLFSTATMLLLGLTCLLYTNLPHQFLWPKNQEAPSELVANETPMGLRFWFILGGTYWGVTSALGLLQYGLSVIMNSETFANQSILPFLLTATLNIIVALLFVFRASQIEQFLHNIQRETREEKD